MDVPRLAEADGRAPVTGNIMRLDHMWLTWKRAGVIAISSLTLTAATTAEDVSSSVKYRPVFEVKLPPDTSALVAAYLQAYRSSTPEVAIKRWESFLDEYAVGESIEDITDLTLLRQAHLELMRLYYRKGRVQDGDRVLKKADDYATYSMPEPAKARRWCRENKYCE